MIDIWPGHRDDGPETCTYGLSRLPCRGPQRNLEAPYIAFVGSTEFFGRRLRNPLPMLVEQRLGERCVNFSAINAGIDAFVNDPALMRYCHDARCTVVQIMGANYMSNRFYTVHPRRNDRFLRPSSVLEAIYPDIDFAEFTFTRHMLTSLYETSSERFDILVSELREAWLARMRNMLGKIGTKTVLTWFSVEDMDDTAWSDKPSHLSADPLFITRKMVEELRPLVADIVDLKPSEAGMQAAAKGLFFPRVQKTIGQDVLGPDCHEEAARTLSGRLRGLVSKAA